jgi:hypothetical protein
VFIDDSELFRRVTGRQQPSLPHPTSLNFDPRQWIDALAQLNDRNQRDRDLTEAAVWFGLQIVSLRQMFAPLLEGLSSSIAVQMLVGQGNRDYRVLINKIGGKLRHLSNDEIPHLEAITEVLIRVGNTGQQQTPDAIMEGIVDTLPHWFFHAWQLPRDGVPPADREIASIAGKTMAMMSLERAYRSLWQRALWEGWRLEFSGEKIRFTPVDPNSDTRWTVWSLRQQSLAVQRPFFHEAVVRRHTGDDELDRVLERSVVSIESRPGQKKIPVIQPLSISSPRQRVHIGKWSALEQSYLEPLLHIPLIRPGKSQITPALLFKAWCVLCDLVEVLIHSLPKPVLSSAESMRQHSLPIRRDYLITALSRSLGSSAEIASEIVNFLTIDPTDLKWLFNRGFWSTPLIASRSGSIIYLVAPALLMGNLVRCVEQWLERGGATQNLESKGGHFERLVRVSLQAAIRDNPLCKNIQCPISGLPKASDGEEIDALVAVRAAVLVIEAKCFISPAEPIDRYTLMNKLMDACAQAKRKSEWLEGRRDMLERLFNWSADEASKAKLIPTVVINQSFGTGFVSSGVPVTDLHYLSLIFSGPRYVADTAVRFVDGAALMSHQELYNSEKAKLTSPLYWRTRFL